MRAVNCRKTKYNLEFEEAQIALKRVAETIAALPSSEIAPVSNNADSKDEGIIETYNESRGFGFISSKSRQHVFFHVSVVDSQRKPCQGSRVTFTAETSAKGLRAVRVSLKEK